MFLLGRRARLFIISMLQTKWKDAIPNRNHTMSIAYGMSREILHAYYTRSYSCSHGQHSTYTYMYVRAIECMDYIVVIGHTLAAAYNRQCA